MTDSIMTNTPRKAKLFLMDLGDFGVLDWILPTQMSLFSSILE